MVERQPIRVVIADDHAGIRSQVRRALESDGCFVCAEGASADEAIQFALEHEPDAVLLDIHMPGNGIHAAQQINRRLPSTAIVMLTQSKEDNDLFDSLRSGAVGYLLKDGDPAVLSTSLRAVLAGEAAMPASLVTRILHEFRKPARRHFRSSSAAARLSPREWEVMEMLGQGLSTEDVGRRLFLSPTTVRVHVSTVLRKLQVRDRESAFKLLRDE
jgi:DNA-binding NarL/FixJ family response regulator